MMRSLFSGVSGLKNHQTRMDVIGNNISNINTIGFKSSRTTFSDMLSQTQSAAAAPNGTLGGINPRQVGLGSAVASVDMVFTDGSAQATGKNTDLTLNGNGLFVLQNGGANYYSRDGAFEFDTNGNFVLPGSGLFVQGWNAVNGNLNTNGATENIVVRSGQTMPGTQTTTIDYSGNINAADPTITAITYTSGGGTADPSSVIQSKTVKSIDVRLAQNVTYDARSMTLDVTDTNGNKIDAGQFENGETYATTGLNAEKIEGVVIGRIDYTLDNTIKSIEGDQSVTVILSNGTSHTFTGITAGTEYKLGATLADTPGYVAADMADDSDATVTKIIVRDDTKAYTYPQSIGYNAGDIVKVLYTDDSVETVNNGTYSVNEEVFNTVNVDGVNVIAATLTLSDGTTRKVTSGFYERNHSVPITTVVTVYDSEGNAHAVPVLIDKDRSSNDTLINSDAMMLARVVDEDGNRINYATLEKAEDEAGNLKYKYTMANGDSALVDPDQVTWDNRWRVYMAPGQGLAGPTYHFTMDEEDGSQTSGFLNVVMDDLSGNPVDGAPSYIYFNEDGSYSSAATAGASLYTVYANGNGASPTTSSVGFDAVTQYAGNTTVYGISDGNAYGVLQRVEINEGGILTGTYSNGIIRNEAQIAVAQFTNNAGLTKVGTSLYQESNNSGTPNIKTVHALGLSITPSSLEMSNVDLANELAEMIITQRGFQSNSKIITVGDEMLETIVNMKR